MKNAENVAPVVPFNYAAKLFSIKKDLEALGIERHNYTKFSGTINTAYVDKELGYIFKTLLQYIKDGMFPTLTFSDNEPMGLILLQMIRDRTISSYVKKKIEDFEKEYALLVATDKLEIFLDTDKPHISFSEIGQVLNRIGEAPVKKTVPSIVQELEEAISKVKQNDEV